MKMTMRRQTDVYVLMVALFPFMTLFLSMMCVSLYGVAQYALAAVNGCCTLLSLCYGMRRLYDDDINPAVILTLMLSIAYALSIFGSLCAVILYHLY